MHARQLCRTYFAAFAASLAILTAVSTASAGDITWTITSGSTTLFGNERIGIAGPFPFVEQAPGSLTTSNGGSFKTSNAFFTGVDFGDRPDYPDAPDVADPFNPTPEESAAYAEWANVTLPAYVAANLHVSFANSGTWGPGPLPFAPIQPPFPAPGTGPAVFGAIGYDDFLDPQNPGQQPMAFRNNMMTFFTQKTGSAGDLEDPIVFPNGAPVNLATGEFDSGAASISSFTNLDTYLIGLYSFGFAGRFVTTGNDANIASVDLDAFPISQSLKDQLGARGLSSITRDGAKYVMTLRAQLAQDLVGTLGEADFADFVVGTNSVFTAVADIADGDVNFDGVVDIFDVAAVSNAWAQGNGTDELVVGDANGDSLVDIFDIATISNNWGATGGGAAGPNAAAVPEPTTGAMSLIALAVTLAWRRRRSSIG